RQLVRVHVRLRGDRGAARGLVDQRHLAEGLPRAELADLLAVDDHVHRAALDDEERAAGLAFLGDRVAGRELPLRELARHALEERILGAGEERDSVNQVWARLRHCEDPNPAPARGPDGSAKALVRDTARQRASSRRSASRRFACWCGLADTIVSSAWSSSSVSLGGLSRPSMSG